jgi:hypothetical protein
VWGARGVCEAGEAPKPGPNTAVTLPVGTCDLNAAGAASTPEPPPMQPFIHEDVQLP